MDLNHYDVYTLYKEKFTFEDILILDWIKKNIDKKRFNVQINSDGKTYYIFPCTLIKNEIPELPFLPDNILKRARGLENKGYLKVITGKWNDINLGYTRTAFRVTRKYFTLLKE